MYNAIIEDLIAKQNPKWSIKMPVLDYLRSLIGAVFNLEKDSRELVYQTLFIISQVNSPKILVQIKLQELNKGQNLHWA